MGLNNSTDKRHEQTIKYNIFCHVMSIAFLSFSICLLRHNKYATIYIRLD